MRYFVLSFLIFCNKHASFLIMMLKKQLPECGGGAGFFHVVVSFISEFYPEPTLLAQPGPVVLPGKNVTLRCQGAFQGMRFALLQEGTQVPLQFQSASGKSADFLLHAVGAEDSGNYSCVYYETTMSNRGSHLSKPLMIWVTGKDRRDMGWGQRQVEKGSGRVIPLGRLLEGRGGELLLPEGEE